MVYSDDGMSEYEQSTSSLVVPTQLELVDEITRLSRIHIDLATAMEHPSRDSSRSFRTTSGSSQGTQHEMLRPSSTAR